MNALLFPLSVMVVHVQMRKVVMCVHALKDLDCHSMGKNV